MCLLISFFFFQAEDGIRDLTVTGVQTCALPISDWASTPRTSPANSVPSRNRTRILSAPRSEEHTSELQSQSNLVCRLLLEKKKQKNYTNLNSQLYNTNIHVCHTSLFVYTISRIV